MRLRILPILFLLFAFLAIISEGGRKDKKKNKTVKCNKYSSSKKKKKCLKKKCIWDEDAEQKCSNPPSGPTPNPTLSPTPSPTVAPTAPRCTDFRKNKFCSKHSVCHWTRAWNGRKYAYRCETKPTPRPTPPPVPTFEPTPHPTRHPTEALVCEKREEPIDVYFAVDGSINAEWSTTKNLLHKMLLYATNNENDRVGIIQYSSKTLYHNGVRKYFGYDSTPKQIAGQVVRMHNINGYREMHRGIDFAITEMLKEEQIEGRQKMIVHLTESAPNDENNPCNGNKLNVLGRLKDNDIAFYTIYWQDWSYWYNEWHGRFDYFAHQMQCLIKDDSGETKKGWSQISKARPQTLHEYRDPSGDDNFLCIPTEAWKQYG